MRLFGENTKESLKEAARKFNDALPLFHSTDNGLKEVLTLAYLGYISYRRSDDRKAHNYFT